MHRFFLPAGCIVDGEVHFPAEITHQLIHVLRLQASQRLVVLDNEGSEFEVELRQLAPRQAIGKIVSTQPAGGEPQVRLALYLCLTQREKFEWMLQKCTEVGAAEFTPVISSRSLVQDAGEVGKKLPRWRKIVQEAAEQSQRGRIPQINPPLTFAAACEKAVTDSSLALIPWEGEYHSSNRRSLREMLAEFVPPGAKVLDEPGIAILIGPEGGFSDEEVALAKTRGLLPVSLGLRILRVETAAVVAAALVLYELGDMGD